MAEATVTSKGQITIPKPVRDALGLATGDRVEFIETDEGYRLLPVTRDVRELKGMFAGVLAELLRVLEDLYSVTREELAECAERLLRARQLVIEHAAAVQLAIRACRRARCGLVDCLIAEIVREKGCERVVTFDRRAAKSGLFEVAG